MTGQIRLKVLTNNVFIQQQNLLIFPLLSLSPSLLLRKLLQYYFVNNFITKASFMDDGLFHSWIHNTLTMFNNLNLPSTRRQTDPNVTPTIICFVFFNNNRNKVKKNTTPHQNLWILFKMALPTNQHNHWLTGNICQNPIGWKLGT